MGIWICTAGGGGGGNLWVTSPLQAPQTTMMTPWGTPRALGNILAVSEKRGSCACKVHYFINTKATSLFKQKIKPVKLRWTQAWRRMNKKGKAQGCGFR